MDVLPFLSARDSGFWSSLCVPALVIVFTSACCFPLRLQQRRWHRIVVAIVIIVAAVVSCLCMCRVPFGLAIAPAVDEGHYGEICIVIKKDRASLSDCLFGGLFEMVYERASASDWHAELDLPSILFVSFCWLNPLTISVIVRRWTSGLEWVALAERLKDSASF